jgi:imidazolonepropionase-like amidohydrolase
VRSDRIALALVLALQGGALPVSFAFAATSVGSATSTPSVVAPSTLILCGALVDVKNRRIDRDVAIEVADGAIRRVGPSSGAGAAARAAASTGAAVPKVVDLRTSYCLPGLIDLHVHLSFDSTTDTFLTTALTQSSAAEALVVLKNAQTMLRTGFTTLRIVGENDMQYSAVDVKRAIDKGRFVGPRMLVAQHPFSPTGGHNDLNDVHAGFPTVTGVVTKAGVDNVREAVREEHKRGADWIKICASGGVMTVGDDPRVQAYTDEEIAAFVDEAHRLRMKVAAHVHGNAAGLSAARAGVDTIEHGTLLEDDTIAMMKKNGVALVPTRYVVDWILGHGAKGGVTEENLEKAKMVEIHQREAMMKAYRAGVKIGVGSDPIFPHTEAVREFAALVHAGLPAWDAVRGGTIVAAEILGLDRTIGSLEVGKRADIVAVPADPVADPTQFERVTFVMRDGAIVRQP